MTEPAASDLHTLLTRLVDHVPSMLACWDRSLRCRFANAAYADWFGVDPNQMVGTSLRDLLGPELYALNEPHIRAVLRGERQVFERVVPGPGGAQRDSLANYIPDVLDGQVVGFFVQVTDIGPLRRARQALHESERRYRMLSEFSPCGVFHSLGDGTLTYANARWREITGLDAEHSLGTGWMRLVHPQDRHTVFAAGSKAVQLGTEYDLGFRIVRPDGSVRDVRARGLPVAATVDPHGEFVGLLEDVTDQRLAMERLRANEAFLDRTGRVAGVGGWELDLRTRRLTWSDRTRRIHEVADDYEPTVEDAIAFYAPAVRPLVADTLAAAPTSGAPWDLELPLVTATGRSIWVRAYGEVEFEDGVAIRAVGALQDITEQMRRGQELQREQALRGQHERHALDLDRLLRERNDMLNVLAHEVRQPLNNASASLQSAAATLATFGERVASRRLSRAQAVMAQVLASIDNTLAVASLLARSDAIRREMIEIDTLLAIAIADMPASERTRVRVEHLSDIRSASVDMGLMRLAVRNLLSNALKFSPPQSPVVVRVSDQDVPPLLCIDVIDAGPGIAQERIGSLFEREALREREIVPSGRGLGLGLYIVRRVMELHGGVAVLAANGPGGATLRLAIDGLPGE